MTVYTCDIVHLQSRLRDNRLYTMLSRAFGSALPCISASMQRITVHQWHES